MSGGHTNAASRTLGFGILPGSQKVPRTARGMEARRRGRRVWDGATEGAEDGAFDGAAEGAENGAFDGAAEGTEDGAFDGTAEGM